MVIQKNDRTDMVYAFFFLNGCDLKQVIIYIINNNIISKLILALSFITIVSFLYIKTIILLY